MKTEFLILTTGLLLAAAGVGFGQPVITQQPRSCTTIAGATATFTVQASGTLPLAYQWQWGLSGYYFFDRADATNAILVLTNVRSADAMDYRVIVTNVDGAITSDVATLTVFLPPTNVKVTPTNSSVCLGASLTLSATASGSAPLSYQWRLNCAPLLCRTNRVLNLTNVQMADGGSYTVVVTNLAGGATSAVATLQLDPAFTKITTGVLVTDPGLSADAACADYDGDGYPDLLVARCGYGRSLLLHNNGDGTFASITNTLFPLRLGPWFTAGSGDFDNDGRPDFSVFPTSGMPWIYFNKGDGTFTWMQQAFGGATVGDYDNDGRLDLYGCVNTSGTAEITLARSLGGRAFQKMTASQVGPIVGPTPFEFEGYPCWADYDDDGRLELYHCNVSRKMSYLFHNDGHGYFTSVTNAATLDRSVPATGAAWADYDNDGRLDLWVMGYDGPSALYRNLGQGAFAKVPIGVTVNGTCNGATWGDYDNDGFLDVFLAFVPGNNMLLHNKGDGTFEAIHTGSIPIDLATGGSICGTWLDYDNDGFLDLCVLNGNPFGDSQPVNFLYHNNGNTNAWLKVKLVGTVSNRDGVGAKVRVKASYAGQARWQRRDICGGDVFNGSQIIAHFGLRDATHVDVLRIEWPSGIVQEFANVPVRQCLTVTEPAKLSMPSPGEVQIQCWQGMAYQVEGSPDLASWTPLATVTNLTDKLQWTDTNAPVQSARFYRAVKQ
jgi:enediyne biosynthesis protein E4